VGVTKKIRLTGHIDVPADRLASVEAALAEHIALTRAEPGCITFSVEPCDQVEGRFLVSELFRDQAAFDAHQARVKASDWGRISAGIPRNYDIEHMD
jgi:quinol monooxygenase YgiN